MENNSNFDQVQVTNQTTLEKIKSEFQRYDMHNWAAIIGLVIFTITMGFTIQSFVDFVQGEKEGYRIFFGIIDRFTYQSNWLLFVYTLMYIIKPNHQFFKGNKFLIATMVYIFFTFIGYNVVLVGISKDRGYIGNPVDIASNVWLHAVAPLYFIFFGYLKMYCKPNQQPEKFLPLLLKGMIYPTIYAIYLATIPWTFTDFRLHPENYPYSPAHVPGDDIAYSIYGKATNTYNYPTSWAYICVMYFFFFPGSFALFYYSWKWLNKINRK